MLFFLLERYYRHYRAVTRQSFHSIKRGKRNLLSSFPRNARFRNIFVKIGTLWPSLSSASRFASPLFSVNGERKHRRGFSDGRRREALTRISRDRSHSSILQDASHWPAHILPPLWSWTTFECAIFLRGH